MTSKETEGIYCDRCNRFTTYTTTHTVLDEEINEKKTLYLCWYCDFDIINGRGDYFDDPYYIAMKREEEDYWDDPINNPMPLWMR